MPPDSGLRLRAEDPDDLAVISACLQDALVSVRDLAYDPAARTFVFAANRFRWEEAPAADGDASGFERIHCGLTFETVANVVYRGFRRSEEDRILALLAIRAASEAEASVIDLEFAAGATVRLNVDEIRCRLHDFGEPWPTTWQPGHPMEDQP